MSDAYYLPTKHDLPTKEWQPYTDVHIERIRAHAKHGNNSIEHKDFEDAAWLPILLEELGEVSRELNEARHGNRSDSNQLTMLKAELIQLAAMTCAWIAAIDREAE